MDFINKIMSNSNSTDNQAYKAIKQDDIQICNVMEKKLISLDGLNTTQQHTLIHDLIEKIKNEINSSNPGPTIKDIRECYNDEVLLEATKIAINIDKFRDIAYLLVPRNMSVSKDLIFAFINKKTSVARIETMVNNVDINYVNNDGETCLWKITDIDYLIELLVSKKLNFDTNITNKHSSTFLWNFIQRNTISVSNEKCVRLINCLKEKKYIFDTNLISSVCICKEKCNPIIYNLFINTGYDITSSTIWLNTFINKYEPVCLQLIINNVMLKRQDYEYAFNTIMDNYAVHYATGDTDMLTLMNYTKFINKNQLLSIITYKNKIGNNLLHVTSSHHLDKCIRFIIAFTNNEGINLLSHKNNNGKLSHDLYMENTVQNLLYP